MSTLENIIAEAEQYPSIMAAEPETSVTSRVSSETIMIAIKDIVFGDNYSRNENPNDDAIKALGEDMKRYQITPITVRPPDANGKYLLAAGHRRVMAATRVGMTHLRAEVVANRTLKDAELNIAENVYRRDLSSMDYAKSIRVLQLPPYNYKQATIAEKMQCTPAEVSNYSKLFGLIPEFRDLLEDSERKRGKKFGIGKGVGKDAVAANSDADNATRWEPLRFSRCLQILRMIGKVTKDSTEGEELQRRVLAAYESTGRWDVALEAIGSKEDQTPTTNEQVNEQSAPQSSGADQTGESSNPAPSAASSGVSAQRNATPEKPKSEHTHPAHVTPLILAGMLRGIVSELKPLGSNPVRIFADGLANVFASLGDGTSKALWQPDEDVLLCEDNVKALLITYANRASEQTAEIEAQAIADKLAPPPVVNGSGKAARR